MQAQVDQRYGRCTLHGSDIPSGHVMRRLQDERVTRSMQLSTAGRSTGGVMVACLACRLGLPLMRPSDAAGSTEQAWVGPQAAAACVIGVPGST